MFKSCLVNLSLILLFAPITCLQSSQPLQIKFARPFILQTGEQAKTRDGKLRIRLKGVGRKISESGEAEYIELQIRLDSSEQFIKISERGNRLRTIGKYAIELINAESFGRAHCELRISRRVY